VADAGDIEDEADEGALFDTEATQLLLLVDDDDELYDML
jgi:hypothetical protein